MATREEILKGQARRMREKRENDYRVSRQEEIREGLEQLITRWIIDNYPIGNETFTDLVKRIQEYEVSQGVVLKVNDKYETLLTEED